MNFLNLQIKIRQKEEYFLAVGFSFGVKESLRILSSKISTFFLGFFILKRKNQLF